MDIFSAENNWRLTVRREAEGVVLLRCLTCDARASLPETLWGLPVTGLGPRALSPRFSGAEGQEVLLTCGVPGEWDNTGLRELTLPKALRSVGDYAFYGCSALENLCLGDGVDRWGGGVLMNCSALGRIDLTQGDADRGTLSYLAGELNRELDVTIRRPEGLARLLFPAFQEHYEENAPAHHFEYVLSGGGYAYHFCFKNRRLDFRTYDELFPGFLAREHEEDTAVRLALRRLRYPLGLSSRAEDRYLTFLQGCAGAAMEALIKEEDLSGLADLLPRLHPDRTALSRASALAREQHFTGAQAILMEAGHALGGGRSRRFEI